MEGAVETQTGGGAEDGDSDNWERFIDEESGASFFVHRRGGKTVWEDLEEEEGMNTVYKIMSGTIMLLVYKPDGTHAASSTRKYLQNW